MVDKELEEEEKDEMKHVKMVSKPALAGEPTLQDCIEALINDGPTVFADCLSAKKDSKAS